MANNNRRSRRNFIKRLAGTALVTTSLPHIATSGRSGSEIIELKPTQHTTKKYSANDQVNIAVIGMGIMGFNNLRTSLRVPGVKFVAACDLYSGHLDRTRELYGSDITTTKDYREILDRKDIDAVFVATSDHWHDRISIEAMEKGKHVYCEKPMVHRIEEGLDVINTQQKTKRVFQVGSQRVSSIMTEKARDLFKSGILGELIMVETWMDRHSALGAWQYSIPTDAQHNTVDWDRFIGDAPKVPYDPVRFFRWRNYQEYGTGMAGDLFVHLFSELHAITGAAGPDRIYATGGLRYWKDGRNVPDIMMALFDYPATSEHPAFNLQMRVNFVDGSEAGEQLRFIGTEGAMILSGRTIKIHRAPLATAPGYGGWDTFNTFSDAQQKEYVKWYESTYPEKRKTMTEPELEFKVPDGYSSNYDHHINFYNGIRENKKIVEDAVFGLRAAAPSLAANKSYLEKKIIHWDATKMKLL